MTVWAVEAPAVDCVAFHGSGAAAVDRWESTVAVDAGLWLAQLPALLVDACDRRLVEQLDVLTQALLRQPGTALRELAADPRARAWLASLRAAVEQDVPMAPGRVNALLAQAPVVLLAQVLSGLPHSQWRAGLAAGPRTAPVSSDVVLIGPAHDLTLRVSDGVCVLEHPAGPVSLAPARSGRLTFAADPPSGSSQVRVTIPVDRPTSLELLDAQAFPELSSQRADLQHPSDLGVRELAARMRDGLALLHEMWPEAELDLSSRFRGLLPIATPDGNWRSATTSDLPLTIQLTLGHEPDPLELAEAVVHECAHVKLDELQVITPLLLNGPERHYRHPWRPDMRPLMGVLLGAHAFANVLRMYEMALLRGVPDVTHVFQQVEQRRAEVAQALGTLADHAHFTDAGERVYTQLRAGVLGD